MNPATLTAAHRYDSAFPTGAGMNWYLLRFFFFFTSSFFKLSHSGMHIFARFAPRMPSDGFDRELFFAEDSDRGTFSDFLFQRLFEGVGKGVIKVI